jgi:hypothetical protein
VELLEELDTASEWQVRKALLRSAAVSSTMASPGATAPGVGVPVTGNLSAGLGQHLRDT